MIEYKILSTILHIISVRLLRQNQNARVSCKMITTIDATLAYFLIRSKLEFYIFICNATSFCSVDCTASRFVSEFYENKNNPILKPYSYKTFF